MKKQKKFATQEAEIAYLTRALKSQKGISNQLRRNLSNATSLLCKKNGEVDVLRMHLDAAEKANIKLQNDVVCYTKQISELEERIKVLEKQVATPWYARIRKFVCFK